MATGPTDKCLDVPKNAYIISGTVDAYNPYIGGNPASIAYAIAWGINQGYLDRRTYLPIVKKAWQGLVGAVHPDGKLGNVQAIGASPAKLTAEDNQEYGSGAFLLAGSEMYKLK